MVADAEAIVRAEGSIWATANARSSGAAGVTSPWHGFTRNLQELGNTFQSPPAYNRVWSTQPKRAGPIVGTDASA
jgi:hypothetical protein